MNWITPGCPKCYDMKLTVDQGWEKIRQVIENDLRPRHYGACLATAEAARAYLAKSAEGQRHKLRNLRKSESEEQQAQRERLSNAITSVALSPVFSYVEEVWRCDGVKKEVSADGALREKVDAHLAKYFHGESLHRYVFEAALHFAAKTDPNAWTVFEAKFETQPGGANSIVDMYPVEVLSEEVRGFEFDETGTLQFLAFEFARPAYRRDNRQDKRELADFYLYGAGFSIHFAEFNPDYVSENMRDYPAEGYMLEELKNGKRYYSRQFTNTLKDVPAIRWAAWFSDMYRLKEVGETIFAPAIPKLEELLKDNTLLQLQKYLHIFAEKHQYVKRCNHRNEEGLECLGGYYGGSYNPESLCRNCKGSGKMLAASEQDVITLAWPDRAEELLDLAKLTHYVERPLSIVEFYRQEVDTAQRVVMYATYNQQNVDVGEVLQVGETATKTRLDYDKIYNKLYPFANLVASAWELAQRTAYGYYGIEATAEMSYPHDFKMKAIAELIAEYRAGKEAGISYASLASIEADIIAKQYRNDKAAAKDIAAFSRWKPWKEKTPEEVAIIIQGRDETDPARMLWENWGMVVDAITVDLNGAPFHIIPPDQQREMLYKKAAELSADIVYKAVPEPPPFPGFSMAGDGEGDGENEGMNGRK